MLEDDLPLPRRRTPHETLLATTAFWNPALAAAITFMFGSRHLLVYWLATLAISNVVAVELYAAALVVGTLLRRPGRRPPWMARWTPALAFALLPAALPLGFRAGAAVLSAYGIPWTPGRQGATLSSYGFSWGPDLHSYRVAIGCGLAMMILFALQQMRSEARERARAAEARAKHLEAARLEARLASLTSEMNPHFLFNALNTVASLVHTDPERAEDVVMQLSDLYRGLLRSSGSPMHALRDELAICEAYLRLEQARFGERLVVEIDVEAALRESSVPVPILVLQPFVENAVTHGISSRARGGRVSVRARCHADGLELSVEDDGVGLGRSPCRRSGKATVNCKDRLRLTYGESARVTVGDAPGGGTRVIVVLPLRAAALAEAS